MGTRLTLDSLRQEIEDNYGPVVIEGVPGGDVKLIPIMRMKEADRKIFSELTSGLSGVDGHDVNAVVLKMQAILRSVCENKGQADRLLKAIGDDGQMTQLIFEKYQEGTNLGKAEPSPN